MRALVTGATGAVGGRLAHALAGRGHEVRCLVRDRGRASDLEEAGFELHEGDVLDPDSLRGAGRGVDVAYYLIHSMGRGSNGGDFAERERSAARAFAAMARADGVGRVVYLGGLGGNRPKSQHLRSRHETAEILRNDGPPLTYFRAAMLVGAPSESYKTLRYLVERLPAMLAPSWLKTRTQPIGLDDAVEYLAEAATVEESAGREVQIGGPDVVTYGGALDLMAEALGRRPRPKLPVPLLSPRLSSLWIGLVTPVDAGVARPLVEGLSTETVVTDTSGARLFDVAPASLEETLRTALAEDRGQVAAPAGAPS
jgi:uncharacterized protein YbjT (DUF2867 family)